MRVGTWSVTISLAGAVALLVFAFGALAQTAQSKIKGTELPTQPTPAPPTWRVSCNHGQAGLDCRAIQMLFIKKTGQRVMTRR